MKFEHRNLGWPINRFAEPFFRVHTWVSRARSDLPAPRTTSIQLGSSHNVCKVLTSERCEHINLTSFGDLPTHFRDCRCIRLIEDVTSPASRTLSSFRRNHRVDNLLDCEASIPIETVVRDLLTRLYSVPADRVAWLCSCLNNYRSCLLRYAKYPHEPHGHAA